jgi:cytochrome c oxidase subunit 4
MSAAAPTAHEETVHGTGHEHPSDWAYVKVAIFLAILTAAEVGLFYVEDEMGALNAPILLVMMVVKFAVVALWFMHLKQDSRLFRRLFMAGLLLAVLVYIAAMVSMQFFGDDTTSVDLRKDNASNSPLESR